MGEYRLILANRNLTLNSVVGAAFGAAGQRCMALSVGKLILLTSIVQRLTISDLCRSSKGAYTGVGRASKEAQGVGWIRRGYRPVRGFTASRQSR